VPKEFLKMSSRMLRIRFGPKEYGCKQLNAHWNAKKLAWANTGIKIARIVYAILRNNYTYAIGTYAIAYYPETFAPVEFLKD